MTSAVNATRTLQLVETAGAAAPRTELAAVPACSVVLTDDQETSSVVPDRNVVVWGTALAPQDVSRAAAGLSFRPAHLRVVLRTGQGTDVGRIRDLHVLAFASLQAMHPRLESAVALVIGGVDGPTPRPESGLFAGLLRSVSAELPGTWCTTILTEDLPAEAALRLAETESTLRQGFGTVAYSGGRRRELAVREPAPSSRWSPALHRSPAPGESDLRASVAPALGDDAVVVAVGGGRGITARCLDALRRPGREAHLYLLGRTPLPSAAAVPVPPLAEFLRERQDDHGRTRVADQVAEHRRRERAAEVRGVLDRFGDRARYTVCDVTDPTAVGAALEPVLARHGGIDLLLFGAGEVASTALPAKRLSDFTRVRDTKVLGYTNLKRALEDCPPRIWCNFSSMSALVGVAGDADYGSACGFLLTAAWWAAQREGRDEFSIAWPAWSEVGMAADRAVAAALRRQGVETGLAPDEGAAVFHDLLAAVPHPATALVRASAGGPAAALPA